MSAVTQIASTGAVNCPVLARPAAIDARYKAGEGAKQHAHPHEQVLLLLSGKCRLTLDGKPTIIGRGMAALIPPNIPHALEVLEDAEVVSCKGVIGGVVHKI
jgi:quercetin dioxygenase-like cupin family protein